MGAWPPSAEGNTENRCAGPAAQESRVTIKAQCAMTFDFFEGSKRFFQGSCNATHIQLIFWDPETNPLAALCEGANTIFEKAIGECTRPPGGPTGLFESLTCEFSGGEHQRVMRKWSFAPPTPTRVRCDESGSGSSSLLVLCEVDPEIVDMVSFEVSGMPGSLQARPFLTATAVPQSYGLASTSITGLRGDAEFRIGARAHKRGYAEGDRDAWSNISMAVVPCATRSTGSSFDAELPPAPAPGLKTRKLEVFRATVGLDQPDFLDQHNAGDLIGELSHSGLWSRAAGATAALPALLTRYCVEILDATLPNVTTTSQNGLPVQSRYFADYASCYQGKCHCMHQVDRFVSRRPEEYIVHDCPEVQDNASGNACKCSEVSEVLSDFYVGRTRVPLPFHLDTALLKTPISFPDSYPKPERGPAGNWYSFPLAGRCPAGAGVGLYGCTWQRFPVSYSVYSDDLLRFGLDDTIWKTASTSDGGASGTHTLFINPEASLRNAEVARKSFQVLGAQSCGDDEGAASDVPDLGSFIETITHSGSAVPCSGSKESNAGLPELDSEVQASVRTIVYASLMIGLGASLTVCLRDG